MNLSDIRNGFEYALDGIGVRVQRTVPSNVNPPVAIVALADGETAQDFDGAFRVGWILLVLLARTDDSRAQDKLDEFLSSDTNESVHAAVNADPTLGGVVDYTNITGWQPPASYDYAGISYVGVEIAAETITD